MILSSPAEIPGNQVLSSRGGTTHSTVVPSDVRSALAVRTAAAPSLPPGAALALPAAPSPAKNVASMAAEPAPAPPAIQTPATLPAVRPPPTEPQPPALRARRARAVTPLRPRHPSAKSSICRRRRIYFFNRATRSHIGVMSVVYICRWCAAPRRLRRAGAAHAAARGGGSCICCRWAVWRRGHLRDTDPARRRVWARH